ncbi:uncharacterized protein LOC130648634 [Hydractinia symbiolongicarpus]|uniref:uncharacterized protein LOC130648634 n=1 Tax=Hydractinia symbiolongicarpus TaxID=13093 RepID=UPI00254C5C1B|nr:uncharacterized protein LOC130648634 [Hydractinia symbiolongicarpus]
MDLQPVHNYYKAVSYMCAYFSKSESESSSALKQASHEIKDQKLGVKQAMYRIASAFLCSRQVSVQEAVYLCLPELWLRKCFPKTTYVNSGLPSDRIRIYKSEEEIKELSSDSTDVFKRSLCDRYIDRPNTTFCKGRYAQVDSMCLALFAAYYYVDYKIDENDSQPDILTEDASQLNHDCHAQLPPKITLMSSKDTMKCRKIRQVLRYHIPNEKLFPEKYAHHLLYMFYPFRSENELMLDNSYCSKLASPGILAIVKQSRLTFEPDKEKIDSAMYKVISEMNDLQSTQNDIPDNSTCQNDEEDMPLSVNQLFDISLITSQAANVSDEHLYFMIHSLNSLQHKVFLESYSWAKQFVKNKLAMKNVKIEPVRLFITGGAGTGKLHLVRTIHQAWEKLFNIVSNDIEKIKVLLIAPTGVAAININGTTINSALRIPPCQSNTLPKLSALKKSTLRNKYLQLFAVIIDEISMVSNIRLLQIHQRLCEIFACPVHIPFANLSVIVVGDLLQLPPIRQPFVFMPFKNEFLNLCHPWKQFSCCELNECMRQQGDTKLIDLLNSIRIGSTDDDHIELLKSRSVENLAIPDDAVYLFAENAPKDEVNQQKLDLLPSLEITIIAHDKLPNHVSEDRIDRALNCSTSEAGGLSRYLRVKSHARVMLTTNIDIEDRLINGQIGMIVDFKYSTANNVDIIFVKFDDPLAGLKKRRKNVFALQNGLVPIIRTEAKIPINKNFSSYILRSQFPLTLAYSCTIHKVQGLTLPNIVFSFQLHKQRSFNKGQVYVALSRVRKLDNIFLTGTISQNAIKTDLTTLAEYERLRTDANFFTKCVFTNKLYNIQISVLNVRSLRKHSKDFAQDPCLSSSDVICLTETQLTSDDSLCPIQQTFPQYSLTVCNSEHKYSSLAMLFKSDTIKMTSEFKLDGFHFTEINKPALNLSLTILLVYKKVSQSINGFLRAITYLIQSHKPDIISGDFNINILEDGNSYFLEQLANLGYTQQITNPTHICGLLLDHLYIKKQFLDERMIDSHIYSLYFSDHDAIVLQF